MRIIEYRAWDDTLLRHLEALTIEQIAKSNFSQTNWYQLTLEQFTGLCDSNNVKIYEGDIVEVDFGFGTYRFEVKYSEDYMNIVTMNVDCQDDIYTLSEMNGLMGEKIVIGNIHEKGE